jgi:hypothetical protein
MHDTTAMQASKTLEAFKKFVKLEEELLQLLGMKVEQNRKMLIEMVKADP